MKPESPILKPNLFHCYSSVAGSGLDIAGNTTLAALSKKYKKSNQQANTCYYWFIIKKQT